MAIYYGTHKTRCAYFNGKRISFIYSAIGNEMMGYTLAGLSLLSLAELNGLTLSEMK